MQGFNTNMLHTGERPKGIDIKAEAPPIFLTTAFIMDSMDEFINKRAEGGYTYNRTVNPNRDMLSEMIDQLEGGKNSIICGSGMGAISTTLMTLLSPGDHLIANRALYTESMIFFDEILKRFGISYSFVDMTQLEHLKAAIRPNTKLIYSEVTSNPMTRVVDVAAVAEIAHSAGAKYMVDNTFTTGYAIKPLSLGADVVVNSMTKFINGHSDAVAGSITTNDEQLAKSLSMTSVLMGLPCDAMTAWLVQRGLFTAGLRLPRQMQNAAMLAAALEEDSRVISVSHPSLKSHPEHELAVRQMGDNSCAMLVFRIPDDHKKLNEFTEKLKLVTYAPTLGGLRTTFAHPATTSHVIMSEEEQAKLGIYYGSIRLSVGLEDIEDLIADFKQALDVYN